MAPPPAPLSQPVDFDPAGVHVVAPGTSRRGRSSGRWTSLVRLAEGDLRGGGPPWYVSRREIFGEVDHPGTSPPRGRAGRWTTLVRLRRGGVRGGGPPWYISPRGRAGKWTTLVHLAAAGTVIPWVPGGHRDRSAPRTGEQS